MENNNSCVICCNLYKKYNRKHKVICSFCDYECCRDCSEQYILSQDNAKCMNCGNKWNREFINNNFTSTFINKKYREHLENQLFNRELLLLPNTQPFVEEYLRKDKIKNEIEDINNIIRDLKEQRRILYKKLNKKEPYNSSKYIYACSNNGCKGYLNNEWICTSCNNKTCSECRITIGHNDEHKCEINNIESIKLLNDECKPCPLCRSIIYKIDGCNQIWCTICHCAFDWTSGQIETKIHNPHYYEWVYNNNVRNREFGDFECGREIDENFITELNTALDNYLYYNNNLYTRVEFNYIKNRINSLLANILFNRNTELTFFNTDIEPINRTLRIKYLANKITEKEFKILLQRNDKKKQKNDEIINIIQFSIIASTDIFYRLHYNLINFNSNPHQDEYYISEINFNNYFNEINELIIIINNLFTKISKNYKCIHYEFNENMILNKKI